MIDLGADLFRRNWYKSTDVTDPDEAADWVFYYAAQCAMMIGVEAIKIARQKLLHADWAYRATSMMLLTTIGVLEGGTELLTTLELEEFLRLFYDLPVNEYDGYSNLKYLLDSCDVPYNVTWVQRVVSLAKNWIWTNKTKSWNKNVFTDSLSRTLEQNSELFQERTWEKRKPVE
ncbi:MAG: hypothetical protein EAX81_06835 [Candidatus Thorarchaeota archaeon]|nr:hypothetical protein [Candidatus Thorarchaeota archaeon]